MSEQDASFERRVHAALAASEETLPPGIASRLAAARAEALAQRSTPRGWMPVGYGALAAAAVLLLAVFLDAEEAPDVPAPVLTHAAEVLPPDPTELDLAMDLELVEDLEFLAWLELEDALGDAG